MPMIKNHCPARKEHVGVDQRNHSVGRRDNFGAIRGRYVDSIVRPPWLSVQNPLRTVDAADDSLGRPLKAAKKIDSGIINGAGLSDRGGSRG